MTTFVKDEVDGSSGNADTDVSTGPDVPSPANEKQEEAEVEVSPRDITGWR